MTMKCPGLIFVTTQRYKKSGVAFSALSYKCNEI